MALRSILKAAALAAVMAIPSSALVADDAENLMKSSDCFTCHQVNRKVVGPAYIDVAKKYKGANPAKVKALVKKVKLGGSGNWGAVPMSPHPNLSDENIEKMVRWVLSQKAAPKEAEKKAAPAGKAAEEKPAVVAAVGAKKEEPKSPVKKARKHAHHAPEREEVEAIAFGNDEEIRHLMEKQDCFGCHSGLRGDGDAEDMPWPSFVKIEAKYKKSRPVAALVSKVRAGEGKAAWGKIPHPHYESLPAGAVDAMVAYILDGKASKASQPAAQVELSAEDWMRKKSDCFTCHAVDKKMTGPAYRDVAKKYAGANASQVATLVKKVKQGGAGNWGSVPMIAHTAVPDAQIEKAVRWVLEQK